MFGLSHESDHIYWSAVRYDCIPLYFFCISYQPTCTSKRCFVKVVNIFEFTLGATFCSSQTHMAQYLWQFNAKLQCNSLQCLQPSHITLIDAAWLHRRLSTHSVCLAVECSWPPIDSSYTGCHLVDQFPLHNRKANATPPLGSHHTQYVKISYGGFFWGGGAVIVSPNAGNKSACKALFQSKT